MTSQALGSRAAEEVRRTSSCSTRRCTFTDDTVCTAAIAHIIVNDRNPAFTLQRWCRRHPNRGYGGAFRQWIANPVPQRYGSFGNGAAMRVSPVALLYRGRSLGEALATSDRVTEITHDHPEGMKGARAVTEAIWLALHGEGAEVVRHEITRRYDYDLARTLESIRPSHRFDVTCQGTVPTALICALESTSLEDAVRNAVSLEGDADTLAAIASAIGEALLGLPEGLVEAVRERYLRDAEDITGALDALYEGPCTRDRPPPTRVCDESTTSESATEERVIMLELALKPAVIGLVLGMGVIEWGLENRWHDRPKTHQRSTRTLMAFLIHHPPNCGAGERNARGGTRRQRALRASLELALGTSCSRRHAARQD